MRARGLGTEGARVYDEQEALRAVDKAVAAREASLSDLAETTRPHPADVGNGERPWRVALARAAFDAASDDLRAARAALLVCQFGFALHETLTSARGRP